METINNIELLFTMKIWVRIVRCSSVYNRSNDYKEFWFPKELMN